MIKCNAALLSPSYMIEKWGSNRTGQNGVQPDLDTYR